MADLQFVPPSWLDDQDAETIHERMMKNLPEDIDDTEAGFPWDFTMPTALEIAELLEFEMMETMKVMHYMFSYGIYLDYHAKAAGTTRKEASHASGIIRVTGSPGTHIPQGFLFAVPASGDEAAITFSTTIDASIGFDGYVDITVEATEAGTIGNVAAGTIIIMASPSISGIESISNLEKTSGGSAEEDDESLRQRIKEIYESSDISFVGNDSDYKRWAKSVTGVGEAIIIPEWNGPGTVKVIILDANGQPANAQIIKDVYNYIVSPDDRDARLAPIGATVTVTAPSTVTIDISCKLTLESGEIYVNVVDKIKSGIEMYFEAARDEGIVKRNRIGSIIIGTEGVKDYTDLTLNGSTDNIEIMQDEYPTLGTFSAEAMEV